MTNLNGSLSVSLRGSLASEFLQLSSKADINQQPLNEYLAMLLKKTIMISFCLMILTEDWLSVNGLKLDCSHQIGKPP